MNDTAIVKIERGADLSRLDSIPDSGPFELRLPDHMAQMFTVEVAALFAAIQDGCRIMGWPTVSTYDNATRETVLHVDRP